MHTYTYSYIHIICTSTFARPREPKKENAKALTGWHLLAAYVCTLAICHIPLPLLAPDLELAGAALLLLKLLQHIQNHNFNFIFTLLYELDFVFCFRCRQYVLGFASETVHYTLVMRYDKLMTKRNSSIILCSHTVLQVRLRRGEAVATVANAPHTSTKQQRKKQQTLKKGAANSCHFFLEYETSNRM